MSQPFTRLAGVSDFARDNLGKIVEDNLVEFYRWGFANAGAYTIVTVANPGTPDPYNPDEVLYPVHRTDTTPDYSSWQSRHPDWCFEQGLDAAVEPLVCRGVYVDGTPYPAATTTGAFAHTLDFPRGRVNFAAPIDPASVVQAAYTYRLVSVFDHNQPWFREIVLGSIGADEGASIADTATLPLLDDYRVATPFVVVESAVARDAVPWELGSTLMMQRRDVVFHVVAHDAADLKNIADALSFQEQSSIMLFDTNLRRLEDAYALDINGSPTPLGPSYPQLVAPRPAGFQLGILHFRKFRGQDVSPSLPLFRGVLRATVEVLYASN